MNHFEVKNWRLLLLDPSFIAYVVCSTGRFNAASVLDNEVRRLQPGDVGLWLDSLEILPQDSGQRQ